MPASVPEFLMFEPHVHVYAQQLSLSTCIIKALFAGTDITTCSTRMPLSSAQCTDGQYALACDDGKSNPKWLTAHNLHDTRQAFNRLQKRESKRIRKRRGT